jgi:hypothetical protein
MSGDGDPTPIAPIDVPDGGPLPPPGPPGLPLPIPGPQQGRFPTMVDLMQLSSGIKPLGGIKGDEDGLAHLAGAHQGLPAPFDNVNTFEDAHNAIQGAADDIAPNHASTWQRMGGTVDGARNTFGTFFGNPALNTAQGWQGHTGQAVRDHARKSMDGVQGLVYAAGRMGFIVDMFSRDITTTKQFFTGPNWDMYQQMVLNGPEALQEDTRNIFNMMAVNFLRTSYRPPVDEVANNHPDVSGFLPPSVGPAFAGPTAPAPGGGGGGGGLPRGGLGGPQTSDGGGSDPAAGPSAPPSGPPSGGAGNAANNAGDPSKAAGNTPQQAAGQGQNPTDPSGDAARKAASDALNGGRNRPPEGVLGLGPKGLSGATKGGGGARGAGTGARPIIAKPAEARMAPSKAPTATPASRAGVSGTGSPGAGAPAAGSHGGAADKTHKASKALHLQKHGQEVVGESEAVVPVIGDEIDKSPPPKPGPS